MSEARKNLKLAHIQFEVSKSGQLSPEDRDVIDNNSQIYHGKRAKDECRVNNLRLQVAFTGCSMLAALL